MKLLFLMIMFSCYQDLLCIHSIESSKIRMKNKIRRRKNKVFIGFVFLQLLRKKKLLVLDLALLLLTYLTYVSEARCDSCMGRKLRPGRLKSCSTQKGQACLLGLEQTEWRRVVKSGDEW